MGPGCAHWEELWYVALPPMHIHILTRNNGEWSSENVREKKVREEGEGKWQREKNKNKKQKTFKLKHSLKKKSVQTFQTLMLQMNSQVWV